MRNAYRRRPVLPPVSGMLLLLAGCVSAPPPVGPDPEPVVVEEAPAVTPVPVPPEPVARRVIPPPERVRADVVLVLDSSTAAHSAVAEELLNALSPRLYRVTQLTTADNERLRSLPSPPAAVVAVGAEAVRTARAALPGTPLVFCQTPAFEEALGAGGPIWGVQTLPPLKLQLESWRSVDPTLRTIALIVSASGAALAAEARSAAAALAADLLVETSGSDRETLYLFRRLATTVDGLWLLPDNDALSPSVLGEVLRYASSRGIGVFTFNEALLRRGALLTATAVPADVAETVAHVVERVVAGRTAELPPMTALSAAELAVNPDVASALGLPPTLEQRWIEREFD